MHPLKAGPGAAERLLSAVLSYSEIISADHPLAAKEHAGVTLVHLHGAKY